MTDIAALGLKIDSSGALSASKNLDQMTAAAKRAENATESLSRRTKAPGISALEAEANKAGYSLAGYELHLKRAAKEQAALDATARQTATHLAAIKTTPIANAGTDLKSLEGAAVGASGGMEALGLAGGIAAAGLQLAVAVIATGIAATMKYAESQDALTLSLMGVGSASGMTATQLDALAESEAKTAGISVSSARAQEAAYLRMGITNGMVIGKLIEISRDYALVTGTDAKQAQDALGKSMSDTAGAGLEALKSLGALDAKTVEYIQSLERQGEHEQAQEVLLGKMAVAVDGASEKIHGMAGAWQAVTTWADNAFDAVGHYLNANFGSGPSSQDLINHYKPNTGAGFQRYGGTIITDDVYVGAIRDQITGWNAAAEKKKVTDRKNMSLAGLAATNALDPTGSRRQELDDYMKAAKAAHDAKMITDEKYARAEAGYRRQLASLYKTENPKGPRAPKEKYDSPFSMIPDSYGTNVKMGGSVTPWGDFTKLGKDTFPEIDTGAAKVTTSVEKLNELLNGTGKELTKVQEAGMAFSRTVGDAFYDAATGAGSFFDSLTGGLARLAAQWAANDIEHIFNKLFHIDDSATYQASPISGIGDAIGSWFGGGSKSPSYDGGGYTGNGSRSGGIDGKGGFWAVMHPQETVTDHAKGQSMPGGVDFQAAVLEAVKAITGHINNISATQAGKATYKFSRALPQRFDQMQRQGT